MPHTKEASAAQLRTNEREHYRKLGLIMIGMQNEPENYEVTFTTETITATWVSNGVSHSTTESLLSVLEKAKMQGVIV